LHSKQNYVIYEINLEKEPDLRKTVKDTLGTTVPQIVIDGAYIGGYKELQEYISKWN
jgi:glutaredoxin